MEYVYLEAKEMSSGIESLLIARQKAKKAMYISDLDDDDDVKPNKIKKLKSSIECPAFSENYIDPDQISETVDYIPERDNKNDNYRQSTSYVKSVFDKSPVKMNNGWSPSPLKAAAKDQLRSASKEQISFKEIDSCTKKVISTTVSRKLKFGDKEKPYYYNNIVNFNILSDEETFDTSVIKNKVSPVITKKVTHDHTIQTSSELNTSNREKKNQVDFNILSEEDTLEMPISIKKKELSHPVISNLQVTRHQILQSSTESNTAGDQEKSSTPLQITSSGSQISHSGVENMDYTEPFAE